MHVAPPPGAPGELAMGRRWAHGAGRAGFMWGALLLLVGVLAIALAQSDLTRNATRWTSRELAVEVALAAAHSDLDAALAHLALDANDFERPLFNRLRAEGAGRVGVALTPITLTADMPADAGPTLWAGAPAAGLSVVARGARIDARTGLSTDGREWNGLTVIRSHVRASGSSSVDRELEDVREVRVARVTAPAPFDRSAIYMGRLETLMDPGAANRARAKLLALHGRIRAALEPLAAASGTSQTLYQTMLREALSTDEMSARLVPLPEDRDAQLLAREMPDSPFALDGLALPTRLAPGIAETTRLADEAASAARAAGAARGDDPAQRRALHAAALAFNCLLRETMRWWSFRQVFAVVPGGSPDHTRLETLAAGCLCEDRYRRIPSLTLSEVDGNIQTRWDALRKRLGLTRGLRAIILVDNPSAQLVLRGSLPGRFAVVSTGAGLLLDGADPGTDGSLLACVIGGKLEVRGAVRAQLVAVARADGAVPTVAIRAGSTVEGALLVPGRARIEELEGTLCSRSGPEKAQGGAPAEYLVTSAPAPLIRREVRR